MSLHTPLLALFLLVACSEVLGQYSSSEYDSPLPPRPVIPGAVPVGGGRRVLRPQQNARRIQEAPRPRPKVALAQRRPQTLPPLEPQPLPQEPALPPRPVVEEPEDQPSPIDDFIATTPQPSFKPAVFRPEEDFPPPPPPLRPQPVRNSLSDELPRQPTRQEPPRLRPLPQEVRPRPLPDSLSTRGRPAPEVVSRPRPRPVPDQQPIRQTRPPPQFRQQAVSRTEQADDERLDQLPRRRKPTAQVLRKYREDNEDGSITWGFENDDGTFKEERIGNDCVTRGKYGYIDPDGVRREFTYSSGLPCDPETRLRDSENAENPEGYIDYSNNRYVLPNGDSVDLANMVKNRARKPTYSNQRQ